MANIIKALGVGTITTTGSVQDLYTVPDPRSAIVNNIRLTNGNATNTLTANLYVKPSGSGTTARLIAKKDHVLAANSMLLIEDVVTLDKGDKVQVHLTGIGASLGFMLNGMERE